MENAVKAARASPCARRATPAAARSRRCRARALAGSAVVTQRRRRRVRRARPGGASRVASAKCLTYTLGPSLAAVRPWRIDDCVHAVRLRHGELRARGAMRRGRRDAAPLAEIAGRVLAPVDSETNDSTRLRMPLTPRKLSCPGPAHSSSGERCRWQPGESVYREIRDCGRRRAGGDLPGLRECGAVS